MPNTHKKKAGSGADGSAGASLHEPAAIAHLEAPNQTLGSLDAESAAAIITAAADVALIVDRNGVIRDVAFGSEDLSREGYAKWLGQPWADTVTVESRHKVEELLRDAEPHAATKGRHVNHTSSRGVDVPVLYSAVQVGSEKNIVAIGRDLRGVAALQQRLVEAQQSMERDYWRLRQAETRYRLLFQMASEAVMIVEASSEKIIEVNPAAARLLAETADGVVGRTLQELFDGESKDAVATMLSSVVSAGRAENFLLRIAERDEEFLVTATLYRQEKALFFLLHFVSPVRNATQASIPTSKFDLGEIIKNGPDAFVVTDPEGRVISANSAFVELAQVTNEEQAIGHMLDRWLGRHGVDLEVLIANLHQHGSVKLFSTTVRSEGGAVAEVEISAVSIASGEHPCMAFTIRNVGQRLSANGSPSPTLPKSVQQLTELVGRVPMKDIVRDTTDLIERLCIEAALGLTRDNRAAAAEMLGLSRQSLYVKLHRFGLGDLGSNTAA